MATNIIGGELQGWAAILAAKEMNKQFNKEMKRQRGFQSEGMKEFYGYAPRLSRETTEGELTKGKGEREQLYSSLEAVPVRGFEGSDADSQRAALMGSERAANNAYGDWQAQQGIDAARYQQNVNRIIDKAGGSARVFPYAMNAAQHSWDQLAAVGQAISSIGGGAANYGSLMGAQPSGGWSTTPGRQGGYSYIYSNPSQGVTYIPVDDTQYSPF